MIFIVKNEICARIFRVSVEKNHVFYGYGFLRFSIENQFTRLFRFGEIISIGLFLKEIVLRS